MISKYSHFTESSSSSSSTISNIHNFHHINSYENSNTIPIGPYHQNPIYHSPYIHYPTSPSNFGFIGNQIIYPNYNSNSKTISYNYNKNHNNFLHGEPVPIHEELKNKCCAHGCHKYISDILYLLRGMKGLGLDKKLNPEEDEEDSDNSENKGKNKKKKNKKNKKKKKKEKEKEKQRKLQNEKWWKLAKNFVNVFSYYYVAKQYSTHYNKIRNNLIELRTHSIEEEIYILKEWIVTLEEPCWEEFEIFIEENCAFQKGDTKNKIRRESLKIIEVIKKYVEYIITGTSRLNLIPERVQQIIYEYIKNGAYFPKKYLTTFQISRLNFDFMEPQKI